MAHIYDDEKNLVELQAKAGRITPKSAQAQMRDLMESEADRLEKVASDLFHERGLAQAYRAKARELRDEIPGVLEKLGGTAAERTSLRRVVTAAADREHGTTKRLDMLEKALAADPMRRPIGMPAPSVPGAVVPMRPGRFSPAGPGTTAPDKKVSEMSNEEKAAYYGRLARAARTPDESAVWQAQARKCAEAARRQERN